VQCQCKSDREHHSVAACSPRQRHEAQTFASAGASPATRTSLRSPSYGSASQSGMSTGRASRACLLNSALLETGLWCKSTAFRHFRARSSKRVGFIPRIALDQCRVPERYRTRAPFLSLWCSPANTPASQAGDHRSEAGQGRQCSSPQSILSDALLWYGSQFGAIPGGGSRFRMLAVRKHPQSNQRSGRRHKPAPPRAALGTATIFASMQQPADFFCKEILTEHHRLEDPFPLLA
jgi:hypothetical protein